MAGRHWGYGLGEMSEQAWQRLHDDAVAKAKGNRGYDPWDVYQWLLAIEQLNRLGLHGMAYRFSEIYDWEAEGAPIYGMLHDEFLNRAWADLRGVRADTFGRPPPRLDNAKFGRLPDEVRHAVTDLVRSDFIERRRNVAFVGEPGTGKSYLASAVGLQAMVETNKQVRLFEVLQLFLDLDEVNTRHRTTRLIGELKRVDAVILEGFGDCNLGPTGEALVARLLSELEGRTSIIITTELDPSQWPEVLSKSKKSKNLIARFLMDCTVIRTKQLEPGQDRGWAVSSGASSGFDDLADDVPF